MGINLSKARLAAQKPASDISTIITTSNDQHNDDLSVTDPSQEGSEDTNRSNRFFKRSKEEKTKKAKDVRDVKETKEAKDVKKAKKAKEAKKVNTYQPDFKKKTLNNEINIALKENDSLHYVIKALMNGNFNAPVNNILAAGNAKVLEVGCANGNGAWTIDMARDYPLSFFIGVDPNAPTDVLQVDRSLELKYIPSNVRFDRTETFSSLPYSNDEFDFVYVKMMGMVLPGGDQAWKQFVKELVRVIKRGGYVEIVDPNFKPYNAGPNNSLFYSGFEQLLTYHGVNPHHGELLGELLDSTSQLSDEMWDYVSVPIGWSGTLGAKVLETMRFFMMSLAPALSDSLGLHSKKRQLPLSHISWHCHPKNSIDSLECKEEFALSWTERIQYRQLFCKKLVPTTLENRKIERYLMVRRFPNPAAGSQAGTLFAPMPYLWFGLLIVLSCNPVILKTV
ncbi:hypothetical protein BC937DRAFT_94742, partial [Endogone sp. FLAS-F59071]